MGIKRETLAQKIASLESTDDCVLWDGGVNWQGHPMVYYRGRTQTGQRVSYQLHIGPIPPKHWVTRTCQNILCLNPKHLELKKAGNPMVATTKKVVSEPKTVETPTAPVIDSIVYDNETSAWHAFYWEDQKMVKYGVFDEYDRAAYALTDYLKESA